MYERNKELRVSKRCPVCGWRVLDKVTPTAGVIELKCPKCKNRVMVDLSYRRVQTNTALRYRLVSSF